MNFGYSLIERVILFEILIVAIIIVLTYFLKLRSIKKKRHDLHISKEVESYLTYLIESNSQFDIHTFRNPWRRMDIVLPIIKNFDKKFSSPHWERVKKDMVKLVFLPLARKKAISKYWVDRLLAVQFMAIELDPQDEALIASLLIDKVPIIHLHAVLVAISMGSQELIQAVIDSMAMDSTLAENLYLQHFEHAAPHTYHYIVNYLKNLPDPAIQAICYKILLKYPAPEIPLEVNLALNSQNLELRLAALRYAAHSQKELAAPLLTRLLSDASWEVRATSLNLLGTLHLTQAIPEIEKALSDKEWWVRINAAKALQHLGAEGIAVLQKQDPNVNYLAYETALQVLETPIDTTRR